MDSGGKKAGKGALIQEEKSATLRSKSRSDTLSDGQKINRFHAWTWWGANDE